MNIKPEICIFSVYQSNENEEVNFFNHTTVITCLDSKLIPNKVVRGNYKGISELSILVNSKDIEVIKRICLTYNQESYLTRHADNTASLTHCQTGKIEPLGVFKTTRFPEKYNAYTFDPDTLTYWVCV